MLGSNPRLPDIKDQVAAQIAILKKIKVGYHCQQSEVEIDLG